jgi:hypothetical protein
MWSPCLVILMRQIDFRSWILCCSDFETSYLLPKLYAYALTFRGESSSRSPDKRPISCCFLWRLSHAAEGYQRLMCEPFESTASTEALI